jgi:hypothetical protein
MRAGRRVLVFLLLPLILLASCAPALARPEPVPTPDPGQGGEIIPFPEKSIFEKAWIWFRNLPWWLQLILLIVVVAAAIVALYLWWTSGEEDGETPDCVVMIDAIMFNHDTTKMSSDAMNIRKDHDETIEPPEWMLGETWIPEDCRAAYSIADVGSVVTIKARFAVYPTDVTSATVWATGGGLLGPIQPQVINFVNGISDPEFVEIPLSGHTIKTGGVRKEDLSWTWQYTCGHEEVGRTMTTTYHRVYVVVKEPQGPWEQQLYPANIQNPWADVLEYSCEWARGTTTVDNAATMITRKVNEPAGNVKYDQASGASYYTRGDWFLCTAYIAQLRGEGWSDIVNCTDCASFVTTFANILGCELWESRMRRNFGIYPIIGIGLTDFGPPFTNPDRWGFSYHEVAWKAPAGNADRLFDACLKVNAREDGQTGRPDRQNPTAELPTYAVFSDASFCYKKKLVQEAHRPNCNPTQRGWRRRVA